MNKLLLLDKDGTLIIPKKIGEKFVQQPWDQVPLPGVREAIAHYCRQGWQMAIISNQGGVAAGHKSLEKCILEMRYCLELFPEIEEAYFCPDFDGMNCYRVWTDDLIHYDADNHITWELQIRGQFRKPSPGMLLLAKHIHAADECWMVGDRPEDEGAAEAAGVNYMAADIWRDRFRPGLHQFNVSPEQLEFLEDYKYKV